MDEGATLAVLMDRLRGILELAERVRRNTAPKTCAIRLEEEVAAMQRVIEERRNRSNS